MFRAYLNNGLLASAMLNEVKFVDAGPDDLYLVYELRDIGQKS